MGFLGILLFAMILCCKCIKASHEPYIGLSLGSRTITISELTQDNSTKVVAHWTADEAYGRWFFETLNRRLWPRRYNVALQEALQTAKDTINARYPNQGYISTVAMPSEVRCMALDKLIIDTLIALDILDPRFRSWPKLALTETDNAVKMAYHFSDPKTFGLPESTDWSVTLAPSVVSVEYNHEFLSCKLIALEHEVLMRDHIVLDASGAAMASDVDLSNREFHYDLIERELSRFMAEWTYNPRIQKPKPQPHPDYGQYFSTDKFHAVVLSGDAPPDDFADLRVVLQRVVRGYPNIVLRDEIEPSALMAVGAAEYAKHMYELRSSLNFAFHGEL